MTVDELIDDLEHAQGMGLTATVSIKGPESHALLAELKRLKTMDHPPLYWAGEMPLTGGGPEE